MSALQTHMIVLAAIVFTAAGCGSGTGSDNLSSQQGAASSLVIGCTEKCHNSSSTISPDPLVTNGTGTAGKHIKHVQERGILCERCHSGYANSPTHMNGILDTRSQTANLVSMDIAGPKGSWTPGSGQCAGAACHGTSTLDWYGTTPWTLPACTACHASTFSTALDPVVTNGNPSAGRHVKHVTARIIACERCHYDYPSATTHANGVLDTPDPAVNIVRFNIVGPAASWTNDTGAQTGDCATVACHASNTLSWYGTGTWTLPASCTTCHSSSYASVLDPVATGGSGTAGKHEKHVKTYNYACSKCHLNYPSSASHANGVMDTQDPSFPLVLFDATSPTGTWVNDTGPGAGACSSVSCHGAYSGTFTYYSIGGDGSTIENTVPYAGNGGAVPGWYAAMGLGCSDCHGNPPTVPNSTQKYVWHSGAHANNQFAGSNDCQLCHPDAVGSNGIGTAITDTTLHANGTPNVQAQFDSHNCGCHF